MRVWVELERGYGAAFEHRSILSRDLRDMERIARAGYRTGWRWAGFTLAR